MSHYCPAIDGMYLRASGEIACWTAPGEDFPMFRIDARDAPCTDFVRDILNGEEFRRMRRELRAHRDPFDYCESCGWGCGQADLEWARVNLKTFELKRIRTLQVEPSFLCNLDCLQCMPFHSRTQGRGPKILDRGLYEKLIDDLVRHGIGVDTLYYAGFGEPLMAPEFPALARYARKHLKCVMNCDTNANFEFKTEFVDCGLDQLVLAIDGNDQRTYEKYRRRGNLARVMRFAERACAERDRLGPGATSVIWKTVLFDWNSTDQDVRQVVESANRIGADEIRLVNTVTPGGISDDYATSRWAEIRALVESLRASSQAPITLISPECFAGETKRCHGFVESIRETPEALEVGGWVLLDDGPADRIEVRSPDGPIVQAEAFERAELPEAHPTIPRAEGGGFRIRVPAESFCPDRAAYALEVGLYRGELERANFSVRFLTGQRFSGSQPVKLRHRICIEVP